MEKPTLWASMGLAGTTAITVVNVTHPIELVKTRIQMDKQFKITHLIKTSGVSSLWKGIQAAWLRESLYTSIKLGMYGPLRESFGATGKNAPFILKFAAGATAGTIGSIIANPLDVTKTVLMAESKKKTSVIQLIKQINKKQGPAGFYRGIQANVMRACVLNGTKMACYDTIKGTVVNYTGWQRSHVKTQFISAIGSGFFMTCTVAPFDMMRTRLMNQPLDKKIYNGFTDCFQKILKTEGPLAFWRGFFSNLG